MIVEILGRRGVRQRVRVRAFPATIGRGYECDVILDDRYVDPLHARLEWDGSGTLLLVDQQSLNGTYDGPSGQRVARVALYSGAELRLGRTTLRFLDESHRMEPTLAEPAGANRLALGESPTMALVICAATGVLFAVNEFLGKTSRVTAAGLLGESLMALLVLGVWAGAWAVLTRVTQHRFRFLEHLAIACLAFAGFTISSGCFEYLRFFFPGGFDWDVPAGAIALAIGGMALAAHLARVSTMGHWPRLLWAFGSIGALAGIVALSGHRDQMDYSGRLEATPLKPVGARWIPSVAPAAFLTEVDGLKGAVDELAKEDPATDDDAVEPDSSNDEPEP
jgi:pSer/pThr/pTyr-binding forkhead associated (FHA) protein